MLEERPSYEEPLAAEILHDTANTERWLRANHFHQLMVIDNFNVE
jgi:hypothetical protein